LRYYHVISPSVETGCGPYAFTNIETNRSAMSIFSSLYAESNIMLLSGSMITHNQIYSGEPPLISVSSMANSLIFNLLRE